MERKTIGAFISILRRASGMTQKELGDKLFVSDKTVSRWERDESAPELSLIPVIADIFGVTTDELLRGEKNNTRLETSDHVFNNESTEPEIKSVKSDKSLKTLLSKRYNKFQNLSMISLGLAIVGLVIALICNFGFYRAAIGFFIGITFSCAAIITEICLIRYWYMEDEYDFDVAHIKEFNKKLVYFSRKLFHIEFSITCFILPMMLLISNTFLGLYYTGWLIISLSLLLLNFVGIILWDTIILKKLLAHEVIELTQKEKETRQAKIVFLRKRSKIFIIILSLSLIMAALCYNLPSFIIKPVVFNDYDSFKAFMELPTEKYYYSNNNPINPEKNEEVFVNVESLDPDNFEKNDYIDNDDNYNTDTIEDEHGNVLCEYKKKNEDVYTIRYSFDKGNEQGLPIKVYTYSALSDAKDTAITLTIVFAITAISDILVFTVTYLKIKKVKNN